MRIIATVIAVALGIAGLDNMIRQNDYVWGGILLGCALLIVVAGLTLWGEVQR